MADLTLTVTNNAGSLYEKQVAKQAVQEPDALT